MSGDSSNPVRVRRVIGGLDEKERTEVAWFFPGDGFVIRNGGGVFASRERKKGWKRRRDIQSGRRISSDKRSTSSSSFLYGTAWVFNSRQRSSNGEILRPRVRWLGVPPSLNLARENHDKCSDFLAFSWIQRIRLSFVIHDVKKWPAPFFCEANF